MADPPQIGDRGSRNRLAGGGVPLTSAETKTLKTAEDRFQSAFDAAKRASDEDRKAAGDEQKAKKRLDKAATEYAKSPTSKKVERERRDAYKDWFDATQRKVTADTNYKVAEDELERASSTLRAAYMVWRRSRLDE